jgi:hypothetical protein
VTYQNAKDPTKLWAEVKAAEHARDARLRYRRERLGRIAGPFASNGNIGEYEPENRLFEFLAYVLPRATFNNPRVRVRSRRSGLPDAVARAMQSVLNRLCADLRIRRMLRANCFNFLTDFGDSMVAPEPRPGGVLSNQPIWWPTPYNLDPHTAFHDPLASRIEDARFSGHTYLRDKEQLVEEAQEADSGWNLEAVQALTEEAGVDEVHRHRLEVPARGEVALKEVFCPEIADDLDADPDDGFSGTLYTLGCSQGTTGNGEEPFEVRKPRAFYGPRSGPYQHVAFMEMEEMPYGLSPTIPAEGQLRDLARTSRAMLRGAARHKTMVTVPAGDAVALAAIHSPDAWALPWKGDPAGIKTIEVGGVTQQQLMHYELKGNTLDRVLGMHDAQRGVATGDATASEVLTAQQGADVRISDIIQVFHDHAADILRVLAWYAYHDDRFTIALDGMQVPGMLSPAFRGGKMKGMTFDDLELEIEPYSMEHESVAMKQRRVAHTMELVGFLSQSIPMAPWMPWKDIIPELTEDTGLEESLANIDIDAAVEWAAAQAQFEGKPQQRIEATSGRQSQGRPINVSVKAGSGRPQGLKALSPQNMGGGKQQQPGKGRVA